MNALVILWLALLSRLGLAAEEYQVRELGRNLEVIGPDGNKVFFGDPAFEGQTDYRIEIPLSALKPPPVDDAKKKEKKEAEPPLPVQPLPPPPQETKAPEPAPPAVPPRVVVEYDDSDRLVLEANRLFNRGKFYEATMVVEELLRRKPEYIRAWVMKGSLMEVQGQKDLAKAAWEKALLLDPNNKEVVGLLQKYK